MNIAGGEWRRRDVIALLSTTLARIASSYARADDVIDIDQLNNQLRNASNIAHDASLADLRLLKRLLSRVEVLDAAQNRNALIAMANMLKQMYVMYNVGRIDDFYGHLLNASDKEEPLLSTLMAKYYAITIGEKPQYGIYENYPFKSGQRFSVDFSAGLRGRDLEDFNTLWQYSFGMDYSVGLRAYIVASSYLTPTDFKGLPRAVVTEGSSTWGCSYLISMAYTIATGESFEFKERSETLTYSREQSFYYTSYRTPLAFEFAHPASLSPWLDKNFSVSSMSAQVIMPGDILISTQALPTLASHTYALIPFFGRLLYPPLHAAMAVSFNVDSRVGTVIDSAHAQVAERARYQFDGGEWRHVLQLPSELRLPNTINPVLHTDLVRWRGSDSYRAQVATPGYCK